MTFINEKINLKTIAKRGEIKKELYNCYNKKLKTI